MKIYCAYPMWCRASAALLLLVVTAAALGQQDSEHKAYDDSDSDFVPHAADASKNTGQAIAAAQPAPEFEGSKRRNVLLLSLTLVFLWWWWWWLLLFCHCNNHG
jgi:hypothetical protein